MWLFTISCYTFIVNLLGGTCAKSTRLQEMYSNPMCEIYLLFYQAALQLFVKYNKFLQREDPIISIILDQFENFFEEAIWKICKSRCNQRISN